MDGTKRRGRPRGFCEDAALDAAAGLFAERGFDAVTINELTRAMGVSPPSFYAAFGSKPALYERVLDRAAADPFLRDALEGQATLRAGLRALLGAAATRYAAGTGCLVAEGTRCADEAARDIAAARLAASGALIGRFAERVGARTPDTVAALAVTALHGLSAAARAGQGASTLERFAELSADAIAAEGED